MAIEAYDFAVTIPAGTAKATPATTSIAIPVRELTSLRWRVPPGPRGAMGFQIAIAGIPVLPTNRGAYIVADDESDTWPLTNQPNSGAWQVVGYNTGIYDHAVFVTLLADFPTGPAAPVTIIQASLTGMEV